MLLHGIIDSPDIPLNVSRSYLQSDGNMPIDCYYFLVGERKDIPDLKAEEQIDKEE